MKRKALFIALAVLLLIALSAAYLTIENTYLSVSRYEIESGKLPEAFDGYTIVQISDFHNAKSQTLTKSLREETVKQKPDLIVLTGDFVDSYKTDTDAAIAFLRSIRDIAPIYFVTGNHEPRLAAFGELKIALAENGAAILDNRAATLEKDGARIVLLGIDDPAVSYPTMRSDAQIAEEELKSLSYDKNGFCVLLSHRPELFALYAAHGVDLVLTGHAHGGQVRIPFLGGLYAPNQGVLPTYTSGSFSQDNTTMIVSRGIGNSLFPFRVNNRPELVVVTLKTT